MGEDDKKNKKSCGTSFSEFLSHKNDDGVDVYCGKTQEQWGKLIPFYLTYYSFLVGFWSMCLIVMIDSLPNYSDGPRLTDIIYDVEGVHFSMQPGRNQTTKDISCFKAGDAGIAGKVSIMQHASTWADIGSLPDADVQAFCGESYGFVAAEGSRACNPCFSLALNRIRGRERATDAQNGVLNMTCYLKKEEDTDAAQRKYKFKFLAVGTDKGLPFTPFPNNESAALRYKDPTVMVRMTDDSFTAVQDDPDFKDSGDVFAKVQCAIATQEGEHRQRVVKKVLKSPE